MEPAAPVRTEGPANAQTDVTERRARSGALGPRVVSALVLAPVALGCVALGGVAFTALVGLSACLMAYEWSRLSEPGAALFAAVLQGSVLVAVVALAMFGRLAEAALVGIGGLALAAVSARLRKASAVWPVLGLVYLGVPCAALVWLRSAPPDGARLVLWTLFLVWAVDIGAYAAGRTFGGPKLAPRISPGKTWSGLVGGAAVGSLVAGLAGAVLHLGPALGLAGLGAALAVLEQGGDLAESAFKRHWQAKDAGNLIPGHGGLLDRVDGLLAVVPVVALLAAWRAAHGAAGLL